mmetsp:Transcript_10903/g.30101  ORF Transcript_10903/g.30101 Transcript_10903/m.30101 type:complete len:334 (+) Transcript_10903:50-1051(+)
MVCHTGRAFYYYQSGDSAPSSCNKCSFYTTCPRDHHAQVRALHAFMQVGYVIWLVSIVVLCEKEEEASGLRSRLMLCWGLEVKSTNPVVHDVEHGLVEDGGGGDKGDDSDHGQTSVDDLGLLSDAELECWQVTEWLFVALGGLLIVVVIWVQEEGVSEWKWADGGHEGDGEEVGVGGEDDGTLGGDGGLSRDGGEGAPCLQVDELVGWWEEAVSLCVGGGADEDPSEHGVASVPLLSVDGWSPSPLGEWSELLCPVLLCLLVRLGWEEVQGAGLLGMLHRSEGAGNTKGEEEGEDGLELHHRDGLEICKKRCFVVVKLVVKVWSSGWLLCWLA